jgi:hypothetical protein
MNTLPTYNFYETYRNSRDYPEETFACAEKTIARLLDTATTSEHPGMLLGKVQSGKTRTFIAAMARAFDHGFDYAIVLSKNSTALINQTCKRLQSEFRPFLDAREMEIYDIMKCPESFTPFEQAVKLIFVAKKEKNNIKRLIRLFSESCPAMGQRKVLIIDDEADNASIGYANKQGLLEARTIARQISDLRSKIPNSSFLQVTATPYSLYLQPDDVQVGNVVAFSPVRPAFTELVPVPEGYIGGDVYFGEKSRSAEETVEKLIHHAVDPAEFIRLQRRDGRSFNEQTILSDQKYQGYRSAIVNFIVGSSIQRINGKAENVPDRSLYYSFLLHSEAAKGSHAWQGELTEIIVGKLTEAARENDELLQNLVAAAHQDLSRSLSLDAKPVPELDAVTESVKTALLGGYITISKINSDEDVVALLDDSGQLKLRTPICIFIGGQVLDRGVTLENLIGFYYGRRPNRMQQDTVMQHSRMYGYRRRDLAVTRFYTSPGIRQAMTQMEEFDASLRAAIEAGGDGMVQFIRRANDGSIIPCSPNKILAGNTYSLRPHKRVVPVGFQTGYQTGNNGIGRAIEELDRKIEPICGFNAPQPVLVDLKIAREILRKIQPTLVYDKNDDITPFDWDAADAVLCHLSQQAANPEDRNQVWLWAAKDRDATRKTSATSHTAGGFLETPDSEKTEGRLARQFAINQPILFLLRQEGRKDKGWRDTPFYWPVIRAQGNTPTAIYATHSLD